MPKLIKKSILEDSPFFEASDVIKPKGPSYEGQRNFPISPSVWLSRSKNVKQPTKQEVLENPELAEILEEVKRRKKGDLPPLREKSSEGLAERMETSHPGLAESMGFSLPHGGDFGYEEESEIPGLETKGVGYVIPEDMPELTDEESQRHWEERGYPHSGIVGPRGEKITHVDPYNPIVEKGPRGGDIYSEELDWDTGANIGRLVDKHIAYESADQLPKAFVDSIRGTWEKDRDIYARMAERNLEAFNKRIDDWSKEVNMGKLFSTQFPTTLNLALSSIFNLIDRTALDTKAIQYGVEQSMSEREGSSRSQKDLFGQAKNYVSQSDNFYQNPKKWTRALFLVYNNNLDLIADDPLNISYPKEVQNGWIQNYRILRESTLRSYSPRSAMNRLQKIQDTLARKLVEPEVAVKERAVIKDVDARRGLQNPSTGQSNLEAQTYAKLQTYERRLGILETLKESCKKMQFFNDQLPGFTLDEAASAPEIVEKIDLYVIKMIDAMNYLIQKPVNNDAKLLGSLALRDTSNWEIYVKLLHIVQAYNKWREVLTTEKGVKPLNIPEIAQILGIQGDEVEANTIRAMIKIANSADKQKLYELSDRIMMFVHFYQ